MLMEKEVQKQLRFNHLIELNLVFGAGEEETSLPHTLQIGGNNECWNTRERKSQINVL